MKKIVTVLLALLVLTSCGQKTPTDSQVEGSTSIGNEENEIVEENPKVDYIDLEDADLVGLGKKVKAWAINPKYYGKIPYYFSIDKIYLSSENMEEIDSFIEDYNTKKPYYSVTKEDLKFNENSELVLIEYTIEGKSEDDIKEIYDYVNPSINITYKDETDSSLADKVSFLKLREKKDNTIVTKEIVNVDKRSTDFSFKTFLRLEDGNAKEVYFKNI